MHPFKAAVEADDVDAAVELLADDVVFHSPVVFKPYRGRGTVEVILRAVFTVFENFRYEREIGTASEAALVFTATIADKSVNGCDFIHMNEAGKIDEFTVMVRPLTGAHALADAMAARLTVA